MMETLKELSILKQNGDEVTLSFSNDGVLKKRIIENQLTGETKETHYFRKNPDRYVGIISYTLENEYLNDAIAISGVFRDDNGTEIEREGLLGNMFYNQTITKEEQE